MSGNKFFENALCILPSFPLVHKANNRRDSLLFAKVALHGRAVTNIGAVLVFEVLQRSNETVFNLLFSYDVIRRFRARGVGEIG